MMGRLAPTRRRLAAAMLLAFALLLVAALAAHSGAAPLLLLCGMPLLLPVFLYTLPQLQVSAETPRSLAAQAGHRRFLPLDRLQLPPPQVS